MVEGENWRAEFEQFIFVEFYFSLVGNEQCEYSKWPIKWVENHFFLNFCLWGWVVFLLHPLLNTLSLKEASRPQLFLMNFNLWYLLLLSVACLFLMSSMHTCLGLDGNGHLDGGEWRKEYAEGAVRPVPGFWTFKCKSLIVATASLAKDLLLLDAYSYTRLLTESW